MSRHKNGPPRHQRATGLSDPCARHSIACATCSQDITDGPIGGSNGCGLPLCETCAWALDVLRDGVDDALAIWREGGGR